MTARTETKPTRRETKPAGRETRKRVADPKPAKRETKRGPPAPASPAPVAQGLIRLPLTAVYPNPDQPRKKFDADALAELAASITQNGLLQPITVRADGTGRYMIVAGERRFRAHQLAGLAEIDANVVAMDDDTLAINAIVENLQRADITPLEEARAFQRMLDRGFTVEQLAERLGIQQPWRIRDRVQLLRLDTTYLDLFEKGHLGPSQAFELSRLTPTGQRALFELIKSGRAESYNKLRAAADGLLAAEAQAAMFDLPPPPTAQEQACLTRLEKMIERLTELCNGGVADNDVVVLKKVNPDRASLLVEQLGQIQKDLARMVKALQQRAAQAALVV